MGGIQWESLVVISGLVILGVTGLDNLQCVVLSGRQK